jgi:PhnB protein
MMQCYVQDSPAAVALYQKAFDAKLGDAYPNDDGTYMHAELDVFGQVVAIAEASRSEDRITGNAMQFCLHFGKGNEETVNKAYEVLKEGGTVLFPLGDCGYSSLGADVIDRFGIRWCLFV